MNKYFRIPSLSQQSFATVPGRDLLQLDCVHRHEAGLLSYLEHSGINSGSKIEDKFLKFIQLNSQPSSSI